MAKKKKASKKQKKQTESVEVHPEARRMIIVTILLALAAISVLAIFELAGSLGETINRVLTLFLGQCTVLFPVYFLWFGYLKLKKQHIPVVLGVAATIFLFSFTALVHTLSASFDEAVEAVDLGIGGGYIGLILGYGFQNLMGFWATLVALIALILISFFLAFNTSLQDLRESGKLLGRIIDWIAIHWYNVKEKFDKEVVDEDDYAEEYEDEEDEDIEAEEDGSEEAAAAGALAFASKKLEPATKPKAMTDGPVEEEIQLEAPKKRRSYRKVDLPLNLLDMSTGKPSAGNIAKNKLEIQRTLENFGIPVEMGEISVGPTVTRYTLKPAEGIKLSRITALQDDLALALAAHPLRIEAPIPGKSLVGIEIPNESVSTVRLRELLESKAFKNRSSQMTMALGKDVSGVAWVGDMAKMPHLLVAGATGSGKSVCLNTLIVSLLYQNGPESLKFIMVDPKRVELPLYNDIPHLLTPVITDVKKTVNSLKWAVAEMDRRYQLLEKMHRRNIESYNSVAEEKLPYIVIVIDEMADLMSSARNDVEGLIIRLAQMARAVGIHLILATQRPSVDVITGLIKANVPTRIAFAVASITDSRTILDHAGAEKLVGKGDMLYLHPEVGKPVRLQGAFLSEDEVKRVVGYLKEQGDEPEYDTSIVEKPGSANGAIDFSDPNDGDELFEEAKEIVVQSGKASTSFLQRRLKVGYSRAARLMDLLEEAGVVGPQDGAKPREILVTEREEDTDRPYIPKEHPEPPQEFQKKNGAVYESLYDDSGEEEEDVDMPSDEEDMGDMDDEE